MTTEPPVSSSTFSLVGSGLADDGIQRVDLGVDQGDLGIVGSSGGIARSRSGGGTGGRGCSGAGRAATCGQGSSCGSCTGNGEKAATRDLFHGKTLLKYILLFPSGSILLHRCGAVVHSLFIL